MPSTTPVKVGHQLTCDEYDLVFLMRRTHISPSVTGSRTIPITSQELLHFNACTKGCGSYYSAGDAFTAQIGSQTLASKYWIAFRSLATRPWEGAPYDAKARAEELFSCHIDYVRLAIANLLGWGFAYIDQPYEWRHQQLSALLEDPSFEVREIAAFCLAESTEFTINHQDFGKTRLLVYGLLDHTRTQGELEKAFQYYRNNPARLPWQMPHTPSQ